MHAEITHSDGVRCQAWLAGEGQPIVFVHGWAMNSRYFEAQRLAFQSSNQVVTMDLRGHGQSSEYGQPPTIERLGLDLVELFAQLDLKRAICVGWSMGAMVLWQAMGDTAFATRVNGLAVVDMSPRVSNDRSWRLGLRNGASQEALMGQAAGMRSDWSRTVQGFVPRIFGDTGTSHDGLIEQMIGDAGRLHPEPMADLWISMAQQDFRGALKKLASPMLVLHGLRSQLYREATSRFVAAQAPDADRVAFADSGHAPHLEEPEQFNRQLRRFVQRLNDKAAPRAAAG